MNNWLREIISPETSTYAGNRVSLIEEKINLLLKLPVAQLNCLFEL